MELCTEGFWLQVPEAAMAADLWKDGNQNCKAIRIQAITLWLCTLILSQEFLLSLNL